MRVGGLLFISHGCFCLLVMEQTLVHTSNGQKKKRTHREMTTGDADMQPPTPTPFSSSSARQDVTGEAAGR